MEVFQITLRKGYGISDLRSDIAALYRKVRVKNIATVFLHKDAQIPDERFLVLINDMLASGGAVFFSSWLHSYRRFRLM
ncbi:dynein beta chain, ciliary-like [Carassius auratus]|uniref:Dynein beta chain, ciliary-like n=1 Tax=Carassius auratus TaxID=7957 RepID=A0A6P6KDZ0_CARAU|nr:dynein beta chain, ciliary-like [Carassius auratus]